MAVRAHSYKIAAFVFDPFDDFARGIAVRHLSFGGDTVSLKLGTDFSQIRGILEYFAAHRVRTVGAGGPTVRNVQNYDPAAGELSQRLHVLDNRAVSRRAIERNQNGFIHVYPRTGETPCPDTL